MIPWTEGNVLSYIGVVYVTSIFQKVKIQFISCPMSVSPHPATRSPAEMLTTSNPSPNTDTTEQTTFLQERPVKIAGNKRARNRICYNLSNSRRKTFFPIQIRIQFLRRKGGRLEICYNKWRYKLRTHFVPTPNQLMNRSTNLRKSLRKRLEDRQSVTHCSKKM